ncbi:MAG TPA: hypothetical protein DCM62_08070 [Bacteroidales bacterium]|nr:hypothetical protein [Bacteroidales bacterium]
MKLLKKILIALSILIVVAIVASAITLRHIARRALPDYNLTLEAPYLKEEVTVFRDQHAIPYIFAKNENDLYFAVGFVMAQDRLWQMDLLRRVTMGRLSEIFGEDMIETDLLLRALRIPEKSNKVLSGTEPDVMSALEAFSNGVNHFIELQGNQLPPEFTLLGYKPEPWQPIHSVNLIGYMAWDLSGAWQIEATLHKLKQHLDEEKFLQLLPNMAHHPTFVYPTPQGDAIGALSALLRPASKLGDLGLEVFSASNSWAVSPNRSTTGYPILANDMHLGFGSPGIWYQMKHEVEGRMKVSGVVLPGQPFVIVGHNNHFAWGMTNVYVDDADFFLETLNPENPDLYLYNDEWLPVEIRQERIAVSDGDTVVRELRFTHRGPVISQFRDIKNQAITMQWTGNLYSNEVRSMYLLNHGRNWNDFRNALRSMTSISQNVIFADTEGNIGLQTAAGVPMRNDGGGLFIYPGHTSQYNWVGLVPFEELPFVFNPPDGMISTANNRTIDESYPHHIGYQFAMPFRIDRIREMLGQQEKHSPEDFQRMLGDFCSKLAQRYMPALLGILQATTLDAKETQALELLQNWDMVYSAQASQPAIFDKFYLRLVHNLLKDEMGEELFTEFLGDRSAVNNIVEHIWNNRNSSWIDNVQTAEIETFDQLVIYSFSESLQLLGEQLGANPAGWQWGELHTLTVSHPMGRVKILDRLLGLNKGPFPVGGSYHTVNPLGYSFRNPFVVAHGASQRHIYQPGNWNKNFVVIPTGTSGIPASDYYLNQLGMFLDNQYHTKPWLRSDVEAQARYTSRLLPISAQ